MLVGHGKNLYVNRLIWTIPWIGRFKLIWEGGTATIEVGDDVGATTIGFEGLSRGGNVPVKEKELREKK